MKERRQIRYMELNVVEMAAVMGASSLDGDPLHVHTQAYIEHDDGIN